LVRVALVDRDGVINLERPDHVRRWSEFAFAPGAMEALALLHSRHWRVIVVTNQSAVGRGLMTPPELRLIHMRMCLAVGRAGGRLSAVYACPHHPAAACDCRKPRAGLLRRAAADWDFGPRDAVMIGDRPTDVRAAWAFGCRAVLVGQASPALWGVPVYPDLMAAARALTS